MTLEEIEKRHTYHGPDDIHWLINEVKRLRGIHTADHTPECVCWICVATRIGHERDIEIEQLRAKLVERDQALTNWYQAAIKRAVEIEKLEISIEQLRKERDGWEAARGLELERANGLQEEVSRLQERLRLVAEGRN